VGLIMFGYALIWIVFAFVSIASRFPKLQFSMAWWGFTFPLGTFALCSTQLGRELHQPFFSILATVVTVCVVLLWSLVAIRTTIEGWKGEIFYAPCLATLDKPPETAPAVDGVML
jgi:tellurite resistance protein TehA-like permease